MPQHPKQRQTSQVMATTTPTTTSSSSSLSSISMSHLEKPTSFLQHDTIPSSTLGSLRTFHSLIVFLFRTPHAYPLLYSYQLDQFRFINPLPRHPLLPSHLLAVSLLYSAVLNFVPGFHLQLSSFFACPTLCFQTNRV